MTYPDLNYYREKLIIAIGTSGEDKARRQYELMQDAIVIYRCGRNANPAPVLAVSARDRIRDRIKRLSTRR